ncbi:helix-turn-helix transcriptional regulator [Pirellulaceae bacterium SH467]
MSTAEPFPFTDTEITTEHPVGTLTTLTDEELRSLAKTMAESFKRSKLPVAFMAWLRNELVHEATRRSSDGRIEPKLLALPIDRMSFDERSQVLMFAEAMASQEFPRAIRDFLGAIRWRLTLHFVLEAKNSDRVLTKRDVAEILSVDDAHVKKLVERGILPEPVYLSPRHPRWLESSVYAALATMQEQ